MQVIIARVNACPPLPPLLNIQVALYRFTAFLLREHSLKLISNISAFSLGRCMTKTKPIVIICSICFVSPMVCNTLNGYNFYNTSACLLSSKCDLLVIVEDYA